jgi:hypothetical protein
VTAEDYRARYGFGREPDIWRARRQRLQRGFRLHLLSPGVRSTSSVMSSGALCDLVMSIALMAGA